MKKKYFSIALAVVMLALTLALLIPVSSTATVPEPSKYVVYASDYMKNTGNYTATTGWESVGLDQGVTSGNSASGLQKVYSEDKSTILWSKYYDKGICAHAPSTVTINITGQHFARFTADAGGNYATGNPGNTSYFFPNANADYIVEIKTSTGETTEVFRAEKVPGWADVIPVDIAIPSDAVELILKTGNGENGNNSDHTAWFDAKFYLEKDPADDYFTYASDFYTDHTDLVNVVVGFSTLGVDKGVGNSDRLCSAYSKLVTNDVGNGKGWPAALDSATGKYVENKNVMSTTYYDKGLAAHANSTLTFNIQGQNFAKFQADLGINYIGNVYSNHSNAKFVVKITDAGGTETTAYESPNLTMFEQILPVSVDIPEGSTKITLITEHDGDSYTSHSTWFDARFVYNDTAHTIPASISATSDTALLTEGNTAKITTSMVAISGKQSPLTEGIQYSVSDPAVLSVDANGTVTPEGSGKATVTVSYGNYSDTVEFVAIASGSSNSAWSATSPDGSLTVALFTDADGKPTYYAIKNGQLIMNESALGMVTSVGDFSTGLTFSSVKTEQQENKYHLSSGKTSSVDQPGNVTTVTFMKGDFNFDITLAAYDEGFAYRYGISAKDGSAGEMTVSEEATTFNFFENTTLWTQDIPSGLYTPSTEHQGFCYESSNNSATAAKSLTTGSYHAMPMLAKVSDDCYLLISEADLYGDRYAGAALKVAGNSTLKVNWAPLVHEGEVVDTSYGFTSPYRMVVVGDLATIVESTLTTTLNPAAEGDFSWVEPGYTAWMWLTEGAAGQRTPETIKKYIDLASEMGWKYLILDDGWQPTASTRTGPYVGFYDHTEEIVAYAKEKNVGLIAWFYAPVVRNTKDENGNFDLSFLEQYAELGIAGVKADFFDSEDPDTLDLYEAIYKKCAELHLIVNCHGANKPTGESRTYPNVINREAAKTLEYGSIFATDVTTWAFIRNVVGAVDATPTLHAANTTAAGMMADLILVESGMPCISASPAQVHASNAYAFLKNMPASWDET